ncbi:MAG TPA: hypothetical protein VGR87_15690 [Candidatus Limnocylindria bacterium]|jgi:hypothetical protein|nr:hypothetical protein [Candidatus Limnocylindria bacterium]
MTRTEGTFSTGADGAGAGVPSGVARATAGVGSWVAADEGVGDAATGLTLLSAGL